MSEKSLNYFELYELPVSFGVDASVLKKKFYELSKRYHPDFYVNESDEQQQDILVLSTQINKAYQVLSDSQKRVEYILTLHRLMADGDKYQLPQNFLMEMMDVNEALMELELNPDSVILATLTNQINDLEKSIFDELTFYTHTFDSQNDQDRKNSLLKIKDIWYRKKYLLRIRNSLNMFAAR
jgi:molecular chaperone HscB